MTPGKFLRLIWPSQGRYCIAHPFTPNGSSVTVYSHHVFDTISEAVTHVHENEHVKDVYFAVLSLREPRVWDPDKTDYKTGQKGAYAIRKQGNMLAGRALFWDLDVGEDEAKYPTQRDALKALAIFLADTHMPVPLLVSSGKGVHAYWPMTEDMPVEEWRTLALNLRQLAEVKNVKVDPTRTTDVTSVLRVTETFNWKDRANPRRVDALDDSCAVAPPAQLRQLITDALIKAGVQPGEAPAPQATAIKHDLGEQSFNDFGPPVTVPELAAACGQVREIIRAHGDPQHPFYAKLDNTAWYRGVLGTFKHAENGDDWCRKLTAMHPRTNADIDAKLLQLEQFPPARCETLQQNMPWKDAPCKGCRFFADASTPNPHAAARKATPAAPPSIEPSVPPAPPPPSGAPAAPAAPIALGAGFQQGTLPNPPYPYERLKAGGIAVTRKDKDGNETTSVIYKNDLFPVRRLVNQGAGREEQLWRVVLPRSGSKDFIIEADVLYDGRKFAAAMAHSGIYPNKADLPALQDYMVAYISKLQKEVDASQQIEHLGWTDEYRQFVLPDKTLMHDGTVRMTSLSKAAERAAQFVKRKGDYTKQLELMRWWDKPEYIPNQFAILCSLASVIFYATGHHGIVVNMSGRAGASKSTTLYAAASLWGDPKMWPINGTNRGATANARSQRIGTNANLPTCVDEITHMPAREAIDFVMNITQPGHRLRLTTDGAERAASDDHKSAIALCTANSSLHALLSADSAAGTAGSVRVFEMEFQAQRVHSKAEADEFLRQLEQNWGHVGEVFAQFVARNRVAVEGRVQQLVREIDAAAGIGSSERFWSAVIACVLTACEISNTLNLLPYDAAALREWAIGKQLPHMRGVVDEEYRDPLGVLTDYIAAQQGSILVVDRAVGLGSNTHGGTTAVVDNSYPVNKPHGGLVGHYDKKAGVLVLLRQAFKDHCLRVGGNATKIVQELSEARSVADGTPRAIVTSRQVRRTLGAGTDYAKGQAWCFIVDMTHPDITGVTPLTAIAGGQHFSDPTGKLAAVAND